MIVNYPEFTELGDYLKLGFNLFNLCAKLEYHINLRISSVSIQRVKENKIVTIWWTATKYHKKV